MNHLAIFHYHLLPGGVTNVIEMSVRALASRLPKLEKITLICGREDNTGTLISRLRSAVRPDLNLELTVEPLIDYAARQADPTDADTIRTEVLETYRDADWLVHNYHLGKNPAFTRALLEFQAAEPDHRTVFCIHDFPESGRYENLTALNSEIDVPLYPDAPGLKYAVINSRDLRILTDAGLPKDRTFLRDNPCPPFSAPKPEKATVRETLYEAFGGQFPNCGSNRRILVYPVRTIRRKNILEAGLICALSQTPTDLWVSLPGESIQEIGCSDAVERAYRKGWIPGLWGFGKEMDKLGIGFLSMARSADLVLSSSVQEGFGYFFINALQWGLPLFARHLEILEGMREFFDDPAVGFYHRVEVPRTSVSDDFPAYEKKIQELASKIGKDRARWLEDRLREELSAQTVDFSYLSIENQLNVLQRAAEDPDFQEELRGLNRDLLAALDAAAVQTPSVGEDSIQTRFGEAAYAGGLSALFGDLPRALEVREIPEALKTREARVLNAFSVPENVRLLYDVGPC